jgi:hypothetical protein
MQPYPAVSMMPSKPGLTAGSGAPKPLTGSATALRESAPPPSATISQAHRLSYRKHDRGLGFDTKALRKVIALRKIDKDERMEQEAILDTYLHALGMGPAPSE